nr:IS66 family transposase [Achromobacter kerstersii]
MCGLRLQPLIDALKVEVLGKSVLHVDETPVQMLNPGSGETPCVPVGVQAYLDRQPARGALRLHAQPGGRAPPHVPGRLVWQAADRRLSRLQGRVRCWHYRARRHGACQAQIP